MPSQAERQSWEEFAEEHPELSACNLSQKDLGIDLEVEVLTDATAAIGICRRRGLGKIRHLAVADLWVQERLRSGDFALTKVRGTDNPSDVLTKYSDRATLAKHIENMGLTFVEGRAESAPELTHAIIDRCLPFRK